jgi:hypothetical protein
MRVTVLIVAPTEIRARDWVHQQGLANHPDFRWRYVFDQLDLLGHRRAMVIMLPRWWERKDADILRDHLRANEAVCIHVDDSVGTA